MGVAEQGEWCCAVVLCSGAPGRCGDPHAGTPSLTTCSLIWMQRDFFLTAATPVVKVLRMLVARRRASWEPPSSPATEPDSTSADPPRPANRLLITFLQGTEGVSPPSVTSPSCHAPTPGPCSLLGLLQQDRGVLGGWVVLDVVEPSRSIVLHPVGPRAVSQEEVSGLVTGEQRVVPCRETQHQWAQCVPSQPWGPAFHWGMSQNPRMAWKAP